MTRVPARRAYPTGRRVRSRKWLTLCVIGLAQLMVVLDTTIINVALPSAQSDLQFDTGGRQWVIIAYSVSFGSLLLVGGRTSDILGHRRALLIGLAGFAAASALGGAADGFTMLVAMRGLQGVFAALLAPAALALLTSTFGSASERRLAVGVYATVSSSGAGIGLLVGGLLTQALSWRWCLFVNVLIAVVSLALTIVAVPTRPIRTAAGRDVRGALLAIAGVCCLVAASSMMQLAGTSWASVVGGVAVAAVLLTVFVSVERRSPHPLLPLPIVVDRCRGTALVTIAATFGCLFATFMFITYYFQHKLGYRPLTTGLAFLPMAAMTAVSTAFVNARLIPRLGEKFCVTVGLVVLGCGMAWMARLEPTSTYVPDVLVPMSLLGCGSGMFFSPAVALSSERVRSGDEGIASALVNASQQIGGALGVSALSAVFTRTVSTATSPVADPSPAATIHGYDVGFGVSAVILLCAAATAMTVLPRPSRDSRTRPPSDETVAGREPNTNALN